MHSLAPIVSFDINLGRHIGHVDVDYEALVDYMRRRGFDDDEIADATVLFTPDVQAPSKSRKEDTFTLGEYFEETDDIEIYPLNHFQIQQIDQRSVAFDLFDQDDDLAASRLASQTLIHELEHKALRFDTIIACQNQRYNRDQNNKYVGQICLSFLSMEAVMLTGEALAQHPLNTLWNGAVGLAMAGLAAVTFYRHGEHRRYLNRPEEIRCRQAEAAGPMDILTLIAKEPGAEVC